MKTKWQSLCHLEVNLADHIVGNDAVVLQHVQCGETLVACINRDLAQLQARPLMKRFVQRSVVRKTQTLGVWGWRLSYLFMHVLASRIETACCGRHCTHILCVFYSLDTSKAVWAQTHQLWDNGWRVMWWPYPKATSETAISARVRSCVTCNELQKEKFSTVTCVGSSEGI